MMMQQQHQQILKQQQQQALMQQTLYHLGLLAPPPEPLERALDECGNDLDAAIMSLHELSLKYTKGNSETAEESKSNMGKGTATTDGDAAPPANPSAQNDVPLNGAEWVELFVTEMTNATSIDDARSRATRVLESLEKSISVRAGAEATQRYHKENVMLREQIEVLLRGNTIRKRAVPIQHECQKEYDNRNQEVNNYALTIHLQQAQHSNSIPGRFNPDV